MERYEEILSKARNADLNSFSFWYSLFGLKEDPFLSPIEGEDHYVPSEIVDGLVYDIGVATRGVPIVVILVGPEGSGKTSLLSYLYFILNSISKKDRAVALRGKYLAAEELFDIGDEDEVQPWMKIVKEKLEFLLVDDARPEHIKLITREFVSTPYKLFSISPVILDSVLSALKIAPKVIYMNPIDKGTGVKILDRRLRLASANDRKPSVSDLFRDDAINVLHKYSMGVPGLLLLTASKCLELLKNIHYHSAQPKGVKRLVVGNDIAMQACKITGCFQAYEEYENVGQFKMEVLREIMKGFRSPTEISSNLRKDRTTISRHLSDLKESGLAEFKTHGRESHYRARDPVLVREEIKQMPKEVWNIAKA